MSYHRRRLPHLWYKDRDLFLTWSLHGSLPQGRYPPPDHVASGEAFVWMDRYLDMARDGPMYLRQEAIARLVEDAIHRGTVLGHYALHAYVIMANHVHMLVSPFVNPSRFMQSLKGFTARQANQVLSRTGQPFWQAESYDHWVRSPPEWRRIRHYIENNPVGAGFAARAEDYRWSSAHRFGDAGVETSLDAAGTSARATRGW